MTARLLELPRRGVRALREGQAFTELREAIQNDIKEYENE